MYFIHVRMTAAAGSTEGTSVAAGAFYTSSNKTVPENKVKSVVSHITKPNQALHFDIDPTWLQPSGATLVRSFRLTFKNFFMGLN